MVTKTLSTKNVSLSDGALIARAEKDFPWWMEDYGVVEIRNEGLIPFKERIWPFQRGFAKLLVDEPQLVVLKARQLGISTILMHLAYWLVRFGPPNSQHVLVLSKSKEDAAYLLAKVPVINHAQPEAFRMDATTDQIFTYTLSNGNTIECLASTESGGRSRAATAVLLDEHAFHRYAERNWAAIKPTLDGGGYCFVVSTGNGTANLFYSLYQKAKAEGREDDKKGRFKAVFIPWDAPPYRDPGWLEREKANSPVNPELFKQEYPNSDAEAFARSGTCPFDSEHITTQIIAADKNLPAKVLHGGRARLWSLPLPGMNYFAGLDCSQGMSKDGKPDKTSLKIIDRQFRHVASYEARNTELGEVAPQIYDSLQMYRPVICVERNGAGVGMIAALQALGYDNFYRYERRHIYPEAAPERHPTSGVQMTPVVKTNLVSLLANTLNTHSLISLDPSFWRECLTFVQMGPQQWGAQGGHNDDEVIAMGWALWAANYQPKTINRRPKKIRWR